MWYYYPRVKKNKQMKKKDKVLILLNRLMFISKCKYHWGRDLVRKQTNRKNWNEKGLDGHIPVLECNRLFGQTKITWKLMRALLF